MAGRPAAFLVAAALAALAASGCARSNQPTSAGNNETNGIAFGSTERGKQVFAATCQACHGAGGSGGIGPSLIGERHRKDYEATVAWIRDPAPPMPHLYPAPLSQQDVEDVATYVQSL